MQSGLSGAGAVVKKQLQSQAARSSPDQKL
jgi:hypothetical protein